MIREDLFFRIILTAEVRPRVKRRRRIFDRGATLATAVAPKEVQDDEVIYYYIFPAYQIRIPLRTGDLLLFNPSIYHSFSNPK